MNRKKIASALQLQVVALEEQIEHLRRIADSVEKIAKRLDIPPISKSRNDLSRLTTDMRWLLPPKIVLVGEALDRIVEEDMKPNMDLMTNSTGNKHSYW